MQSGCIEVHSQNLECVDVRMRHGMCSRENETQNSTMKTTSSLFPSAMISKLARSVCFSTKAWYFIRMTRVIEESGVEISPGKDMMGTLKRLGLQL